MNRWTLGTAAAVAACSLAACAAPDVTPPADGGTYESIEDLRRAVESAGLRCPELVLDRPPAKFAASSGNCGENLFLATYSSDRYLQSQLDFAGPVGQEAINVGKNWTVVSEDPERLRKHLGGTVLHTGP
jgi:hypothetical protein